ncbi:MAG TPA: hypothetical protein VGF01_15095 [Terracidiphilus sp.]|jgi:thymidylate kinase
MGTRTKGGKKSASLVIFSGMDCSGKSTQISALMESFKQRGERPIYIWLRVGYTPLFNAMKSLLRRLAGSKRLPQGESPQRDRFMRTGWKRMLWLHVAFIDMAIETAVRIRLLKILGRKVLCDRYTEDSERDLIMNFGEDAARLPGWKMVKAIAAKPDVGIFLDLSFEESLRRSIQKNEPFADSQERRLYRAGLYEKLKQQGDYCIVDAQRSIQEVSAAIGGLVFGNGAVKEDTTEVVP